MTLDYSTVGPVKITMLDYIYGIIDDFDKEDLTGGGTKSSAATDIVLRSTKTVKILMQN